MKFSILILATFAVFRWATPSALAAEKAPPAVPPSNVTAVNSLESADSTESSDSAPIDATITYCSDGDTCRIVTSPGKLWVNARLAGIDAPEVAKKRSKRKTAQAGGDAARDFLQKAIQGKKVSVKQSDLDHYNRPVVEIFLDGKNINLELVSKGFAEAYRGKTKRIDTKAYVNAEAEAKAAKLGIWGTAGYESPAAFRKRL